MSIIYFKASHPNNYLFQTLKIAFILAKSVGTDEMPRYVAFHLGFIVCQSTPLGVSSIRRLQQQISCFTSM